MQNCKTCKHWKLTKVYGCCEDLISPPDPVTYIRCKNEEEIKQKWGTVVRCCEHPKIVFCQRPSIDGAAVVDGSEFFAKLITAENFGCVLHEFEPSEEQVWTKMFY